MMMDSHSGSLTGDWEETVFIKAKDTKEKDTYTLLLLHLKIQERGVRWEADEAGSICRREAEQSC